jgi:pimeloyl-ACP methyl ester carboxylesterase
MEARLDTFAEKIVARVQANDVDEIVVVGHSLGATLVTDAVGRALARDPDFPTRGPPLCILTVGATLPAIALHPKGDRFRQAAERIAFRSSIAWVEYHARDDAISFYRFDPVALSRVPRDRHAGRPLIRRVQLRTMMQTQTFKRNRFSFMRLHYQFVMGNDRRAWYDYFMIICGPLPFAEITGLEGGVGAFAADGTLISAAAAAPGPPVRPQAMAVPSS